MITYETPCAQTQINIAWARAVKLEQNNEKFRLKMS